MWLYRLIYVSRRSDLGRATPVISILDKARTRNPAAGLTGALLFDDNWFVQILEGGRGRVSELLAQIMRDPRHVGLEIVWAGHIDERRFASFAMAGLDAAAQPADVVRRFTNGVAFDPTLMTAEALMRFAETAIRSGEIVFLDDNDPPTARRAVA